MEKLRSQPESASTKPMPVSAQLITVAMMLSKKPWMPVSPKKLVRIPPPGDPPAAMLWLGLAAACATGPAALTRMRVMKRMALSCKRLFFMDD